MAMAAKIVALAISGGRVVRVASAHNSHFVGIVSAAVLHRRAVLPGLADVAAVDFGSSLRSAQQVGQYLVISELVSWGKVVDVSPTCP